MNGNAISQQTGQASDRFLDVRIRALTIDLTLYRVSLRQLLQGLRDKYTLVFFLVLIGYMSLAHPDPIKIDKPIGDLLIVYVFAILYVVFFL